VEDFVNPPSTTPTDSFLFHSYNQNDVGLDEQTTGIELTAATDTLTTVTLSSSEATVGQSPCTLTVSFRINNEVPEDGKIYLQFPYWNEDTSDPN